MKKFLISITALALLPVFVHAQNTIHGKVYDKITGEVLAGAHIMLNNTYLTTVSNPDGSYRFTKLKAGTYTLKASYIGYETMSREIEARGKSQADLFMEPATIMQDEVVIRGIRTFMQDAPSFSSIPEKTIGQTNLGQDVPYILGLTPSVTVTSDAGNGVGYTYMRIRGTDLTGINITLNGIPLNDPESHGVWFVNMPDLISSANNIQIQRGVGTSMNGAAAFGASVNIQTKQYNANPYATINSSYGSYNTLKNTLRFGTGLIKGRWTFDGRASMISSDGYIDRATTDLKSFYLSGAYHGEKSLYRFNIFSGKEKTYQAWAGVSKDSLATNRTFNPYTYENETDNYQQDHYQLLFARSISRNWKLNTAMFYVRGRGYYEQFKEDRSFTDYQLNDLIIGNDTIRSTDLVQQKWLDNHFYGITWSVIHKMKKLDLNIGGGWNRYEGDHYGRVIWAEYAAGMKKDHEWYFNDGIKTDFNLYAKANYHLYGKLNVYGDLQYRFINYRIKGIHDDLRDISQTHDFNFINPKMGVVYNINDKHHSYFSFGIANREPNRSMYRDAGPGEEPVHETLYDYELGHKYASAKISLTANAYYMDYTNQLVLTGKINNVGTPVKTNVKNSYRMGIEVQAGLKLLKNLKWDLHASFSRNKIRDFTAYIDNWNYWDDPDTEPYQYEKYLGETDISFSPPVTAGSILDYEAIKNLHITLYSNYVGKQYIDNTSNEERKLDPYFLNDMGIIYTINTGLIKEISIQFRVNNLFSEEYESNAWVYRYIYDGQQRMLDGYFPQAPINYLVGVGLKF